MSEDYKAIKSRIRSAIRQVWSRYSEERKRVLYNAKRTRRLIKKDGSIGSRPDVWYICASCSKEYKLKDVQVDHIKPLGATPPFPGDINDTRWISWIMRLFCNYTNLQVLCKTCHNHKTKSEKAGVRSAQKSRTKSRRASKIPKRVSSIQRKTKKKTSNSRKRKKSS